MTTELPSMEGLKRRKIVELPISPKRLTITQIDGEWRGRAINRLEQLVRLEPGWDGYSGQPVSLETATFALRVLEVTCNDFTEAPQIVPGSNGEIQMEWHTDCVDVEVLIHAPNDVHAWRHVEGGDPEDEEINLTNDFIEVAEWIRKITESEIAFAAAA